MEDAVPELEGLAEAMEDIGKESSGDFGDFMTSIEQSMLSMMKETAKAPETAMEHWQAFSAAVDWSETWIRCLLSFHLVLLTIVLLTRKNVNAQTVLFLLICTLAFLSEHLNTYCAANWTTFSKQNYFDKHGAFAGIMYAGPLLIIGLFQLVSHWSLCRCLAYRTTTI
jgi:pantothenate kinase